MPELPEVETIKRDLEKAILHKTFGRIEIPDPFVLRNPPKEFVKVLSKQSITAILRRGKVLIICVMPERFNRASRIVAKSGSPTEAFGDDRNYLIIQLMMTGQLVVGQKPGKHTRVLFKFTDNSELLYNDQRRFGQLRVVKDLADVKHLQMLGPEPFDPKFNGEYIFDYMRQSRRPIKTLLLDHTFVAGIGNIYACEILFRSGISPKRQGQRISRLQAQEIHKNIVKVLNEAIAYRGSSMRNYRDAAGAEGTFKKRIQVYAREGQACLRCKKLVQRIIQAGRSTFFCPQCQK